MYFIKKALFKFLEFGLGLRVCISLETKNPIFINFRLSSDEVRRVQDVLPQGWELQKICFAQSDEKSDYWISYNLYELQYPNPKLQHIRKARCEINTFVRDPQGRKGVFVFSGSPYVSMEKKSDPMGKICDFAEKLVIFIYGCGKLIDLTYELAQKLKVEFKEGRNDFTLNHNLSSEEFNERLSDEYWLYNDISFFNDGKTFDLVNVSHSFFAARFHQIDGNALENCKIDGPFFNQRRPDKVYYHRGAIAYLVNALNRVHL